MITKQKSFEVLVVFCSGSHTSLKTEHEGKKRKPQNPTIIVIESVQVRLQILRKRSQESYLVDRSINKSPLSNKRDA